jgi:hypothetical protein
MTLTFTVFFLVIADRLVDVSEKKKEELLLDLGEVIEAEIELAATAEPGYQREFMLPPSLRGINYNMSFHSSDELKINASVAVINITGHQNIVDLPKHVYGILCKGKNYITRLELRVNISCNEPMSSFFDFILTNPRIAGRELKGLEITNLQTRDVIISEATVYWFGDPTNQLIQIQLVPGNINVWESPPEPPASSGDSLDWDPDFTLVAGDTMKINQFRFLNNINAGTTYRITFFFIDGSSKSIDISPS